MRLIDADYLKNLPFERIIHTDFGDTAIPIEEIDNAPTVGPRIEYGTDGQPYKLSMTNGKEYERTKGEWINREAISNTIFPFWERYECNQCHKFNGYSNFCPNCGAKMI